MEVKKLIDVKFVKSLLICFDIIFRSSRSQMFYKIGGGLKSFAKIHRKTPVLKALFNTVAKGDSTFSTSNEGYYKGFITRENFPETNVSGSFSQHKAVYLAHMYEPKPSQQIL